MSRSSRWIVVFWAFCLATLSPEARAQSIREVFRETYQNGQSRPPSSAPTPKAKVTSSESSAFRNTFGDTIRITGKSVTFSGKWNRVDLIDRAWTVDWIANDAFIYGEHKCQVAIKQVICDGKFIAGPTKGIFQKIDGSHASEPVDEKKAARNQQEAPAINLSYLLERANESLAKGNIERAISDLNKLIASEPKNELAFNTRGLAWWRKGELDRAITDYNEAIRLNPQLPQSFQNRGLAWEAKKNLQAALSDFKQFAELAPADPEGTKAVNRVVTAMTAQPKVSQPALPPPVASPQVAPSNVPQGRKVALLIGNSAYQKVGGLQNPKNDVQLLATTLKSANFQSVVVKTDLSQQQILQALKEFSAVADGADWALLYYSGHGIEFGGVNYLVPVEANLKSDRDVDLEAVDIGKVMSAIGGAKRLRLVILDACRDNPFASQMKRTVASRSVGRGLARMEPEAGTLIAYAAKHGETALDGDGANSPYAQALAKRIRQTPPLEVRRVFDIVRDDVMESTGQKQQPFSYGSVSGSLDFYFAEK